MVDTVLSPQPRKAWETPKPAKVPNSTFEGRKPFEMLDEDSEEETKEMYEVSPSLKEA